MPDKRETLIKQFKQRAEESIISWYDGFSNIYWSQLPTHPTSQEKSAHFENIINQYDKRINDYKESIRNNDWIIETKGLKIRPEHWKSVDSFIEEMRNKYLTLFKADLTS